MERSSQSRIRQAFGVITRHGALSVDPQPRTGDIGDSRTISMATSQELTAAIGGFDLNSFPQEASMLVTLSRKIAHV
jgi:hypothetical protein